MSAAAASSEVSERYGRIATGFGTRLEGVDLEQWSKPTPCTEWTVRDLVGHVVQTHWRVLGSLAEAEPVELDAEGDMLAQRRSASAAVAESVGDPDRASRTVKGMFGEQPFESLVGRLLCADTLLHTWDLARATGQDEVLDSDAVSKSMAFLTPIDEAIRRPGGFAPKIDPPPGTDDQTRLLNFCGRAG